jgi:lysophospholipase L1-like esterase
MDKKQLIFTGDSLTEYFDWQELAKNFMADYLDVHALFTDSCGCVIRDCLLDDGVHLSAKGYEVWSQAVEDYLRRMT